MSKIVAIICEYNPFHNGHKYQIEKIRKDIPDATILCIMSGNVTQRGEFVLFDKYSRAKAAVLEGANAVLEIPFPYSASNAELFARAGVEIATKVGVDYLCFGSESADLNFLEKTANIIDSKEFEVVFKKWLQNKSVSYLVSKQKALKELGIELPTDSNDILAIEYLRSIKALNSTIKPLIIKREGNGYKDQEVSNMMSACAIRANLYENSVLTSVPKKAKEIFEVDISNGYYINAQKAEEFLFLNSLMATPERIEAAFDVPQGCGYFISETAKNSENAKAFFENLSSKTYTAARLRRGIMYLATGIKNVEKSVYFTNLLAADKLGREMIKSKKKDLKIKIITKHSDTKNLDETELELYVRSKKVEELFMSLLVNPQKPSEAYKKSVIII